MRVDARAVALLIVAAALEAGAIEAGYRMEVSETGMQDYYCRITVALQNETDSPLKEINGHFYAFVGEREVGRSRGASFLDVPSGGRVEASFLTPNVLCDDVTGYRFIVGGCRLGGSFAEQRLCADRILPVAPIMEAIPR